EFIATPGTFRDDLIHEKHMSMVYTPGIPPPESHARTSMYGVPVLGNNYHSS
ncbi:4894_t:CDS:1, partial [Dentiscutata heterogama]